MAPWPRETIHTEPHRVAPEPGHRRLAERGGQRVCRCQTAFAKQRADCAICCHNGCWRSWRPADWCPGYQSHSASALHAISPRIASRRCGPLCRSRSARWRWPLQRADVRLRFRSPLASPVCLRDLPLQHCRPRVLLIRSCRSRSQAPCFPGLWRFAKSGSEATVSWSALSGLMRLVGFRHRAQVAARKRHPRILDGRD